jgi:hypothetical protein
MSRNMRNLRAPNVVSAFPRKLAKRRKYRKEQDLG